MTLQFGSGSGSSLFTTAPTSGVPSIAIGTGTFAGGVAPDFQGTSAIGVNMAAGYGSNLADLQIAGVSKFKVDSTGGVTAGSIISTSTGGDLRAANWHNVGGGGSRFQLSNGFSQAVPGSAATVGFAVTGVASQTSDLLQTQDSGSVNHFGIANIGIGGSPIWCMRVAPVANAASMAQAHVGGASTGKAIQVIDNTGTTIGWLQLLA